MIDIPQGAQQGGEVMLAVIDDHHLDVRVGRPGPDRLDAASEQIGARTGQDDQAHTRLPGGMPADVPDRGNLTEVDLGAASTRDGPNYVRLLVRRSLALIPPWTADENVGYPLDP